MRKFKKAHSEKTHAHEAGYILIEVTIALVIIGMLLGTTLPAYFAYQSRQKIVQTKAQLEQLKHHIELYTQVHGNAPCPSTPESTDVHFGESRSSCTNKSEAVGTLPFVTLGLPPQAAKDAYGHFITYAVAPIDVTPSHQQEIAPVMDPLQVTDLTGESPHIYGNSNEKTPLQFVLMSHGQNGCGAFLPDGQRYLQCQPFGPEEQQNARNDLHYVMAKPNDNETTYFDDLLTWSTYKKHVQLKENALMQPSSPWDTVTS